MKKTAFLIVFGCVVCLCGCSGQTAQLDDTTSTEEPAGSLPANSSTIETDSPASATEESQQVSSAAPVESQAEMADATQDSDYNTYDTMDEQTQIAAATYAVSVAATDWGRPVGQRVYTDAAMIETIRGILPDIGSLEKEPDPPDGGIPILVSFYENDTLTAEWTFVETQEYTLVSVRDYSADPDTRSGPYRASKEVFEILTAYTDWQTDTPVREQ